MIFFRSHLLHLCVCLIPIAMLATPVYGADPATVAAASGVLDLRSFERMPGAAKESMNTLGMLMYQAPANATAAFDFQQQRLTKAGWEELPGGYHNPNNHSAQFTKDEFQLFVSVSTVTSDPDKQGWSHVSLINNGNVRSESLPVPQGVKPLTSWGGAASYLTETRIDEVADQCRRLLTAAGWSPYGSAGNGDTPIMYFKINAIRVMVWVSKAPAQGNQTMIRYSTELLSADLPVPPDAPDPRYEDVEQSLRFEYPGEDSLPVVKFYRDALAKLLWRPTTDNPIRDAKEQTELMIFRNAAGDLIELELQHFTGIVRVKVDFDSADEVHGTEKRLAAEAAKIAALAPPRKSGPPAENDRPERDDFPDTSNLDGLLKSAQKMAGDAIGEASKAMSKVANANDLPANVPQPDQVGDSPEADKPKFVRRKYSAKITSNEQKQVGATLQAGGANHTLAYGVAFQSVEDDQQNTEVLLSTKPISVDKVVALLNNGQDGGEALGFDPQLKLKFDSNGKLTYLFLYADGLSVNLGGQGEDTIESRLETNGDRARGNARLIKPGKLFDNEYTFTAPFDVKLIVGNANASDANSMGIGNDALDGEEFNGLPLPLITTSRASSGTQFRNQIVAKIPAPLDSVLVFYRTELAKRGWKEEIQRANVAADQVSLDFTSKEGTVGVTLRRLEGETEATLSVRYPNKAEAAGIAPQAGKGRLILGNASQAESVLMINGRQYKVAAGKGANNPKDGVSLHVLPGNYQVTIKVPGQADQNETIKIAIGETWGVIVLPESGFFADQVY